jgi:hypothetical protein
MARLPRLGEAGADQAPPLVEALTAAVAGEVRRAVPEYAWPEEDLDAEWFRRSMQAHGRRFTAALVRPGDAAWRSALGTFEGIGACAAECRRGLDGLQASITLGGQAACRILAKEAGRQGWNVEQLAAVMEAVFVYVDDVLNAAADGYSRAQWEMAGGREQLRRSLAGLLVRKPPPGEDEVGRLAEQAGWGPVRTLAVVAVRREDGERPPVLPPDFLTRWDVPDPYLIWPDPDGPGPSRLPEEIGGVRAAAVGPTVALDGGATSLRWACETLALIERGVIRADRPVRCLDHLPSLVTGPRHELIDIALRERLAPLMSLPPKRRTVLARTLLAYLESRDNAVVTAERLRVHKQTVRNRVHELQALLGGSVHDPARRVELLILLHYLVLTSPPV